LKIECLNEGFLWILSYFTPVFSHFVNESWVRFDAGWIFVSICAVLVVTNMTVVVINVVKVGIQKYKKRRWMKYYGLDKLPESKFGVKVEKE
jgi:hypothetical protein